MYRKSMQDGGDGIENVLLKLQAEIWHFFEKQDKGINILEVWLWRWDFAYFCEKKGFKNYTWVDIDDTYIAELKGKFKDFNFLASDIVDFLKDNSTTYDIIFMSHVFEHFNSDTANNTIKLIFNKLNKGWYWINYMPNADSPRACASRYIDITHQSIYNTNSFEQILFTNGANFSEIIHYNTLPAINPLIKRIFKLIHPLFLISTKVYYYGMWLMFPKIYTSEILTIMKK